MPRKATILCLALLAAWAAPSAGSSVPCTTQMVAGGICRLATNQLLYYDAPLAAFADLRDAIAEQQNYQDELPCAATRTYEPRLNGQPSKILTAAGVAEDGCTLGQPVANPQSAAQFADAQIEEYLRDIVIQWKHRTAMEAADDPSLIPEPDIGGSP